MWQEARPSVPDKYTSRAHEDGGQEEHNRERDGDTGQSPFRLREVKTVMSDSKWGRE